MPVDTNGEFLVELPNEMGAFNSRYDIKVWCHRSPTAVLSYVRTLFLSYTTPEERYLYKGDATMHLARYLRGLQCV